MYDLSVDKHHPICEQHILKRAQLTHLAFNAHHPLLVVEDDRGNLVSLKLSPNLRKAPASKTYSPEGEAAKLSKLVSMATDSPAAGQGEE